MAFRPYGGEIMQDARKFYINGAWVAPLDGRDLMVTNPSTEEPFATISLGGQADTDAADPGPDADLVECGEDHSTDQPQHGEGEARPGVDPEQIERVV